MTHKFADLAFTNGVKALQVQAGSRASYARMEGGPVTHDRLGDAEAAFITGRNSFYMATVSETGWPYVQHRGGPTGFVRVLDDRRIGFADFRGNRQYVSTGNLGHDDRISMIFVDYPNRQRLKILGRAAVVGPDHDPDHDIVLQQLNMPDYRARVERGIIIQVDAFDWNCPQHITPRYAADELDMITTPLLDKIAHLENELAAVRP